MVKNSKTNFFNVLGTSLILLIFSCSSNNTTPKKPISSATPAPQQATNTTPTNNVPAVPAPPPPPPPIIQMDILAKGSTFDVDGPLWYDGVANVEELNASQLRINITIAVPAVGLPYEVKDGKSSIQIKIEKDANGKYSLMLNDLYKKVYYLAKDVKFSSGKTDAGWFGKAKDFVKVVAFDQDYLFTIEEKNKVAISVAGVSLLLTKK